MNSRPITSKRLAGLSFARMLLLVGCIAILTPVTALRPLTACAAAQIPTAAAATAPAPGQPANPLAALHWQKGPLTVPLSDQATLRVPVGFAFLSPPDAKRFMQINQNPTGQTPHYIAVSEHRGWFVDFSFDPTGYVRDNQTIDADAVLASIREGTAAANQERQLHHWASLQIIGWDFPPRYDSQTHRLEWAVLAQSQGQKVVNYETRLLGRRGVMKAVLVDDPDHLAADLPVLKQMLTGFAYNPGDRYSDHKPGDKIAEYGLAALITGGAAVAVVKTGMLSAIIAGVVAAWKFILVGLVAAAGAVRRFFKGRGGNYQDPPK